MNLETQTQGTEQIFDEAKKKTAKDMFTNFCKKLWHDERGEGQMDLIIRIIIVIVIAGIVLAGIIAIAKMAMNKAAEKTEDFFDAAYIGGYSPYDGLYDFDEGYGA